MWNTFTSKPTKIPDRFSPLGITCYQHSMEHVEVLRWVYKGQLWTYFAWRATLYIAFCMLLTPLLRNQEVQTSLCKHPSVPPVNPSKCPGVMINDTAVTSRSCTPTSNCYQHSYRCIAMTCDGLWFAPCLLWKPVRDFSRFWSKGVSHCLSAGFVGWPRSPFYFLTLIGMKHILLSQLRGAKQSGPEEPQSWARKQSSRWRYLLILFCYKIHCSNWSCLWSLRYFPLWFMGLRMLEKQLLTFSTLFFMVQNYFWATTKIKQVEQLIKIWGLSRQMLSHVWFPSWHQDIF